jgi:hypothetical protein
MTVKIAKLFYVGQDTNRMSPNWPKATLNEAIEHAKQLMINDPSKNSVNIVKIIKVVKASKKTTFKSEDVKQGIPKEDKKPIKVKIFNCPKCSSKMVKRTARRTNKDFYGCSKFPKCRGTRELDGSVREKRESDGFNFEPSDFEDEPF